MSEGDLFIRQKYNQSSSDFEYLCWDGVGHIGQLLADALIRSAPPVDLFDTLIVLGMINRTNRDEVDSVLEDVQQHLDLPILDFANFGDWTGTGPVNGESYRVFLLNGGRLKTISEEIEDTVEGMKKFAALEKSQKKDAEEEKDTEEEGEKRRQ